MLSSRRLLRLRISKLYPGSRQPLCLLSSTGVWQFAACVSLPNSSLKAQLPDLQLSVLPTALCEGPSDDHECWDVISLEEVKRHTSPSSLWVTYNGSVYDVTDFIAMHPGGTDLLSTVGGLDLGPFWELYGVHHRGKTAHAFLEGYKIGVLSPDDARKVAVYNELRSAQVEEERKDAHAISLHRGGE